jgi:hypothetical protein
MGYPNMFGPSAFSQARYYIYFRLPSIFNELAGSTPKRMKTNVHPKLLKTKAQFDWCL